MAYEDMTPEEQEIYRENRMTHGQRYQAWEDEQVAKKIIMAGLVVLFSVLYMMIPIIERVVLG